jgi:hypothetical protein
MFSVVGIKSFLALYLGKDRPMLFQKGEKKMKLKSLYKKHKLRMHRNRKHKVYK